MDKLEKVEKLRERANVTYEEAKAALEENGWDLLDAMVALEKSGKTESPKQEQFSTSYDQQAEYIPVQKKVEQQKNEQPHIGKSIGDAVRNFIRICRDNALCVAQHGKDFLRLPLYAAILILLFAWRIVLPAILISLLFGFRYSFEGKDDLKDVNAFMESAGNAAESLKEGFNSARNKNKETKTASADESGNANS